LNLRLGSKKNYNMFDPVNDSNAHQCTAYTLATPRLYDFV